MSNHRLKVIENLDPNIKVLDPSGPGPLVTGTGSDDYLCGACENVLIAKMRPGQIPSTMIRCGKCGATSVLPETGPPRHWTNAPLSFRWRHLRYLAPRVAISAAGSARVASGR